MTRNEFIIRTGFGISEKEYEAVEVVYMASDLDKDEFCKMWCKMNASRVKAAHKEHAEAIARANNRNTLFYAVARWEGMNKSKIVFDILSADFFKKVEIEAMNRLGIRIEQEAWVTIANIREEFKKAA